MTSINADLEQQNSIHFLKHTGFIRRSAAFIIDGIMLSVLLSILFSMFYGNSDWLAQQSEWSINTLIYDELLPLILVVIFWVYKAATPGKMFLNSKVVDAKTGDNLSVGQSIVRYIGYFISALPLGLGFIWILIDDKNRGWHDMLAGSVVIRTQ
ncbi:RDD family protein [Pseudoalteromonas denitrificans]|uniref:Uncharacterized membrane protein YckC, RDD family n=1 Tax=Pseudoalteromonas denitrificans DSM 6059 TaxID=1123010 RepID=A0A1I1J1H5_9GAMM|nr:RDD family protein [Pseudoalteromonas denitrificans]SFC42449.1 Uncharacterized membrane protein YckC, RDD family [Pseudoalteromonas denitrificans DSM 6059]